MEMIVKHAQHYGEGRSCNPPSPPPPPPNKLNIDHSRITDGLTFRGDKGMSEWCHNEMLLIFVLIRQVTPL